jgi:hypothetical protein
MDVARTELDRASKNRVQLHTEQNRQLGGDA